MDQEALPTPGSSGWAGLKDFRVSCAEGETKGLHFCQVLPATCIALHLSLGFEGQVLSLQTLLVRRLGRRGFRKGRSSAEPKISESVSSREMTASRDGGNRR